MMMPLLVFAIIALYLVGQIGSLAIKGSDIDVETVAYGTIDTPEVYTGLILREEYVVDSTRDGQPYYQYSQGDYVPKGAVVCTVKDTDSTDALESKLNHALLTQQKYADAATAAVNSINEAEKDGCKIMSQSELMNGFANITSATKEAMYAAMTQNDQTVYFYSFYAYMSWNFNSSSIRTGIKCISQSTYDLMSPTDLRRQWWDPTGKAEVPATSYNQRVYQNRKFTARSTADAVGDFAFMRISEMYLTAAEAFARSNQDAKAKEYLQALLKERDPEYKDLGNTGAKLADEIMTHRRIELWGEGFRWFDLKRLGLPLDRTGSNFDATFCGFLHKDPNADGWIFEIPKKETDFNDLIEKNY